MEKIILYTQPMSPVAEAYRSLCTNFLASLDDKKVIEVVDVSSNGNSCTVLVNLAVAAAQAGQSVLLMDCNFRNPKLQELCDVPNNGLADCFATENDWHNYVQQTLQTNLKVLTAGIPIDNPVGALLCKAMQDILNAVRLEYDVVLINVPSVKFVTDAVSLGTKTDGVVLVLSNKEDKVEIAQRAKEVFVQAGVNIVGCVLVNAEPNIK